MLPSLLNGFKAQWKYGDSDARPQPEALIAKSREEEV